MRIAIISDIHGNLPALEAVLADVAEQHPDAVYCLGDLVGYGASLNEVTERIRAEGIRQSWAITTMAWASIVMNVAVRIAIRSIKS